MPKPSKSQEAPAKGEGLVRSPPADTEEPYGTADPQFMDNAYKLIYGSEEVLAQLLKPLDSDDPVAGLADAGASIWRVLMRSASESGKNVDIKVATDGAQEIINDIAKISAARDVHKFSKDEINEALKLFVDLIKEEIATANKNAPAPAAPAPAPGAPPAAGGQPPAPGPAPGAPPAPPSRGLLAGR